VIVAAVWHFLLKHNKFGIYTIAVGSNAVGSREVGIPTDRIRMVNFILAAFLGGLVGIVESFHVQSIDPLAGGTSILLQGIAAAVIGGTALTGGSGTIVGALIGSVVIASLNDGMNLLGVNAYLFDVVLGIAIGIAMILNIRMMGVRGGRQ
jgi:simple sugar transport system permease protein